MEDYFNRVPLVSERKSLTTKLSALKSYFSTDWDQTLRIYNNGIDEFFQIFLYRCNWYIYMHRKEKLSNNKLKFRDKPGKRFGIQKLI